MTTDYGGPPPTPDADAAGYWAGRTSTDTETPGPCRLVPGEHPDRVLIAASVAASGWPVLALWPGTKKPTHRGSETPNHGEHWLTSPVSVALSADEHDDREPPEGALRGCPSYAVMTGQPSPVLDGLALVALDLDGNADALTALLAEAGSDAVEWATETLRVQRTEDRAHLWGTVPGVECPPTADLAPGLEWRGSTGYAALPGARHRSGALYAVTGGRYEFTDGGQPDGALYVGMTDPDDADPLGLAVWVHPLPVPESLLAVVRDRLGAAGDGAPDRVGKTTDEVRELLAARSTGTTEPPTSRLSDRQSGAAYERVLDALRDAGRLAHVRDAEATAHCPGPLHAHGDRHPGLSVTGVPGRVLVHCFAGCETADVLDVLGLSLRDLYDDENGGGAVLHEVTEPTSETDETPTTTPEHRRRLVLTPASAIKPKRVRWLWSDRIALGSLALLAGREGLGKSSVAYDTAARITLGTLPGEFHGEPRAVLVCATEDSWAHTIVPRLIAAAADLTRIYRVEVETSEGLHGTLSLPRDLDGVEAGARETGASLLILDPLTSRLTEALDTHKDSDVRRALEPMSALADRSGIAVWGLMHHNKSGSTDPLSLVMGSRAFTAVARSVHTVVPDPDDDSVRFFGTPKNNLGRTDLPTLSFTVESFAVPTDDGPAMVGRVVWGDEVRGSIGDAMRRSVAVARRSEGGTTATDEAADWLLDYLTAYGKPDESLGDGRWAESSRVKEAAEEAGHSERPLRDARKRLGLVSESVGFPRRSWWSLPPKRSRDTSRVVSRGEVMTTTTGRERAGQNSRDSRDVDTGTGTTEDTTDGEVP